MNILLTNDDGFDADGIKAIRTALEKSHNVYVVAPTIAIGKVPAIPPQKPANPTELPRGNLLMFLFCYLL